MRSDSRFKTPITFLVATTTLAPPPARRAHARRSRRRDDLLAAYEVIEVDQRTGAEVVRWVRRFPLMCKQRDYVFSRRSWVDGCVAAARAARPLCAS